MKDLFIYAGQVILVSGLLYGYYYIFLRDRRFHRYNRFYLLLAVFLSLIIPLIHISLPVTSSELEPAAIVRLLKTVHATDDYGGMETPERGIIQHSFNGSLGALAFYIVICLFLVTRVIIGLLKLKRLASKYPSNVVEGVIVYNTKEPGTPFSIFGFLFWNDAIDLYSAEGNQILHHEMVHIRQRHSYDIIFMELLTAFCWINPFFFLVRKELRIVHEFLADEPAAGNHSYAELLLMHSLKTRESLVNPFFHNQIRRRIAMITQQSTSPKSRMRQIMILPFIALLFVTLAFRVQSTAGLSGKEEITVIVDAGHGGFDPGGKSPDKKFDEASMSLAFASLTKSLAPEYGIRVILTRSDANAIGANKIEDLKNRLKISKDVNPAVFLSFHVNTVGKGDTYQTHHSGFDLFVSGKREDVQARMIGSALLEKLSSLYQTQKVIKQRNDAGIYVLDQNNVPSVMLQCGYINNQKDLEFFNNGDNQEKTVRAILSVLREQIRP